MHYFYQYKESVAPPISRIGLIQLINTVVEIGVALNNYDFIQMGYIGTHPLENNFGSLSIVCHCDHSYSNIFRANKFQAFELDLELVERIPKVQYFGGIILVFTPFQLFKIVWQRMKNNESNISFFESWFPLYKTSNFDERIESPSILSGCNIITRYLNLNDKKNDDKVRKVMMKYRKKDRIEKKFTPISQITADELDSLEIDEDFYFLLQIIIQYILI